MVNASTLTEKILFQTKESGGREWQDVAEVYACMTGLKNSEYWVNYMGGNADECLTVSVRYRPELAALIPQLSRIVHGKVIYDIISPPDDVLFKHTELKFRARRQIS